MAATVFDAVVGFLKIVLTRAAKGNPLKQSEIDAREIMKVCHAVACECGLVERAILKARERHDSNGGDAVFLSNLGEEFLEAIGVANKKPKKKMREGYFVLAPTYGGLIVEANVVMPILKRKVAVPLVRHLVMQVVTETKRGWMHSPIPKVSSHELNATGLSMFRLREEYVMGRLSGIGCAIRGIMGRTSEPVTTLKEVFTTK